jgi:hypothetical protein
MIGQTISQYRILEKLGEVRLHSRFVGHGGLVRRSSLNFLWSLL